MIKVCLYCKGEYYIKRSHAKGSSYCSRKCMATGYSARLRGEANPNYRGVGNRKCVFCLSDYFHYYNKKYCSFQCYSAFKAKNKKVVIKKIRLPKPVKIVRPKMPKKTLICRTCKKTEVVNYSDDRKYCNFRCYKKLGSSNPNWRGGINGLSQIIRGSRKNRELIRVILRRDDYTCQECGTRGGDLEVDHIVKFEVIFREFLTKYDDYDTEVDKAILANLAMKYEMFWEKGNLRTLCRMCNWHREMAYRKTKRIGFEV